MVNRGGALEVARRHPRRALAGALTLLASACTVPSDLLEGQPCPCVDGWICRDAVCVRDDGASDAGPRVDAFAPEDGGALDAGGRVDAFEPDMGETVDASTPPDGGPPGPSLVAHWACESLELAAAEGRMADASGNGHTATCTPLECPTIGEGRVANGCVFAGAHELRAAADEAFDPSAGFTVAGWVKTAYADGSGSLVSMPYGTDRWNSWQVFVYNEAGGINFVTTNGTAADAMTAPDVLGDGTWHHFAATWDGVFKRLFVDASLVAQETPTDPAFVVQPVLLGRDENEGVGAVFAFDGALDEVRIYDGALDDAALLELATPP